MAKWNFRKSVKLAPGVRVTFSKRGASVSAGPKGYKVSVNSRGDVHRTVSIPGTGLYKRERVAKGDSKPTYNNPAIITDEQLADMSDSKKRMYRNVCYFGIGLCVFGFLLFLLLDLKLLSFFFLAFGVLFYPMSKRYK